MMIPKTIIMKRLSLLFVLFFVGILSLSAQMPHAAATERQHWNGSYTFFSIGALNFTGEYNPLYGDVEHVTTKFYAPHIDDSGVLQLEFMGAETYTFNLRGDVISYEEYDLTSLSESCRYVHDSDGRILRSVEYTAEDSLTIITSYEYDENGRCIEEHSSFNDESFVVSKYEYDVSGNLIATHYYDNDSLLYSELSAYEDGRLVKESKVVNGETMPLCEYRYDSKGRVVGVVEHTLYNESFLEYRFEYNDNGDICTILVRDDDNVFTPHIVLVYHSSGKLCGYYYHNEDLRDTSIRELFSYDDEGRAESFYGIGIDVVRENYYHDEHSNICKSVRYLYDDTTPSFIIETEITYR